MDILLPPSTSCSLKLSLNFVSYSIFLVIKASMLFQTCLLSSLYIWVHSSTYILVVSTYYRETLILRFTTQGELSAQLTSFHQSWFYCVVNGTPIHPDTPVRILCLHLFHLRSITSQLYLLLRCGLSSLSHFLHSGLPYFPLCRRPAFSIISTSCLLFYPSMLMCSLRPKLSH